MKNITLNDEQLRALKVEMMLAVKRQYELNQINKSCISDFEINRLKTLESIRQLLR